MDWSTSTLIEYKLGSKLDRGDILRFLQGAEFSFIALTAPSMREERKNDKNAPLSNICYTVHTRILLNNISTYSINIRICTVSIFTP